ncbi:MAG TPA: NAD(P)H-binding protein [Acidimicrobiales bacterium]
MDAPGQGTDRPGPGTGGRDGGPVQELDLVTGAFGNTGRAIARLLLGEGRRVRTLTNHPGPRGEAEAIEVRPYRFDDPDQLAASFTGVDTFYDTFWMRTGTTSGYEAVVERSRALIAAAERAGVRRIVHLSVAHASEASPFPYFRAKALVESAVRASSVPAAIVRPALIFGGHAVLLNNLAWLLRRLPVFAVAGDGSYRVRPVHVDDVARLCIGLAEGRAPHAVTDAGAHGADSAHGADGADSGDGAVDAVGPERPTYLELVTSVRDLVGGRARLVRLPAALVLQGAKVLGSVLRDDVLTRDELVSTMEGLADTEGPATGDIRLSDWLRENASGLGQRYINERRQRRPRRPGRHPPRGGAHGTRGVRTAARVARRPGTAPPWPPGARPTRAAGR